MKTSRQIYLFITLTVLAALVIADDVEVDTSAWKCKYCEFEEGMSHEIDAGLGYVSEDSFKFGEYTGLYQEGAFFVGNIESRYRNENANYWNISASNLGLDSRSLDVEGGKQGLYKLTLQYDELPHYVSDTAATPFLGDGENRLTLPPGWVNAGSTGGMSALAGSLHEVDLETKRKRVGVGAALILQRNWTTAINYRHEVKEGKQRIAGTFYFSAAQLVQPVDYTTDQVDASVSYTSSTWQARLAYTGSTFRNGNDSLIWENPYTPIVAGADTGELALSPDNQFHQITASIGTRIGEHTRTTADIGIGRMTQDEEFLAATLNPNIVVAAPAASSLNGRVDTANVNLKVVSDVSDQFKINASYRYSDRDNKIPQETYNWVTTDANVATPKTNLPYSFTNSKFKLSVDYRPILHMKASVGYDNDAYKRTFQEVEKSREKTFWVAVVTRASDGADMTFKAAHANRDKSGYEVVQEIDSPENPLLRKFNMADRDRDSMAIRIDAAIQDNTSVGLGVGLTRDSYSDSDVGLTSSKDSNISVDISTLLTPDMSMYIFLNREQIESRLAGSQAYSTADWVGNSRDTIDTGGIGVSYTMFENKFNVGVDYYVSHSRGEITINNFGTDSDLPDLISKLKSFKLHGTYHLSDNLTLKGTYWYESYDTTDWAQDDVDSNTITNVLTLGQQSPSYDVNVVTVSVRYKF